MNGPQRAWLSGGRLHLHHGPIDLIVGCHGTHAAHAYQAAAVRFQTILPELVEELPALRRAAPVTVHGPTARRMARAVAPFAEEFVTPMAAVAGAVAEEVIQAVAQAGADRAYVNNGGDVAFHLGPGQTLSAAIAGLPGGRVRLAHDNPARGIASSGWRGRSWSFGIADNVTVLARTAAEADVAATMIANAVDLPGHPAIVRQPASDLAPDSDLADRSVTTSVGPLSREEAQRALDAGRTCAETVIARGLAIAAVLSLNDFTCLTGETDALTKDP